MFNVLKSHATGTKATASKSTASKSRRKQAAKAGRSESGRSELGSADAAPAPAACAPRPAAAPTTAPDMLLTAAEQDVLVCECYEATGFATAAYSLGLNLEVVMRTRREVPAFAQRLDDAAAYWTECIAEKLVSLSLDLSVDIKDRVAISKQIVRQRPPESWMKAKAAARPQATGKKASAKQPATKRPAATRPAPRPGTLGYPADPSLAPIGGQPVGLVAPASLATTGPYRPPVPTGTAPSGALASGASVDGASVGSAPVGGALAGGATVVGVPPGNPESSTGPTVVASLGGDTA